MARAEAHVVRLALIYALLDRAEAIDRAHIDAALALWAYAARSARWIFGDTLGDPVADDIWSAIKGVTDGLSRAEIRDVSPATKAPRSSTPAWLPWSGPGVSSERSAARPRGGAVQRGCGFRSRPRLEGRRPDGDQGRR